MHYANFTSHASANWFRKHNVNTSLPAAGHHHVVAPSKHDKLVSQTQKWVATTFYGEMLKQMRESPFKTDLTDGGRGGETFATMLDQHLSEKMAKGAGSKLVNAIVRKIEAKRAYAQQMKSSAIRRRPAPSHAPAQEDGETSLPHTTGQIDALRSTGRMHVTPTN